MESVFYIRWRDTYLHGFTASGSALWTSDLLDAVFLNECRAGKLVKAIPIINETVSDLVVEEYGGGYKEKEAE